MSSNSRFQVAAVGSHGPFYAWDSQRDVIPHGQGTGVISRRYAMSELYDTALEAQHVVDWLTFRAAGYPIGELATPPGDIYLFARRERACGSGACCKQRRLQRELHQTRAYHGDIDGDSGY